MDYRRLIESCLWIKIGTYHRELPKFCFNVDNPEINQIIIWKNIDGAKKNLIKNNILPQFEELFKQINPHKAIRWAELICNHQL